MFRKQRQPAPFFNMPGAPFNPATGERAPLANYPSKGTTLALFQVIEEDTHDNYVVCRGYEAESDPEHRYLHDPYAFPTTTPINVAKPYSVRGTFPYELGQVIVAARIRGKLGFNPGKAETTVGQPADLDEAIELLLDDEGVAISWLELAPTARTSPTEGAFYTGLSNGADAQDIIWDTTIWQVGDLFSFSTTDITLDAEVPEDTYFHIEWTVQMDGESPTNPGIAFSTASLVVNGVTLAFTDTYEPTYSIRDWRHFHTSFWDVALEQGDVIKIHAFWNGVGTLSRDATGRIRITRIP